MYSSRRTTLLAAAGIAAGLLTFAGLTRAILAQSEQSSDETTSVVVVVKEADNGDPISQARITLQFTQPGGPSRLGKSRKVAYSAKTDGQGRCRLSDINKGPIVLMVTADGHQSYGKQVHLERDNQVFEVKLKKPQPLI